MTALLALDDVRVWFGGVKAVDGVTATVQRGLLCGIVGPNGSGKTTLINAISGVCRVTDGRIDFDGTDVRRCPPHELNRRGLARTFQAIRLLPTLSVRENVLLGADRAPRAHAERATDEAIERLGLGAVVARRPHELSYGHQRRVEIARALAGEPTLLLLDEPVAGMNREERDGIAAILDGLRRDGLTQVIIEHDLRMLLGLCDHLLVMSSGQLIAEGDPRATAALPVVQEAYLGHERSLA